MGMVLDKLYRVQTLASFMITCWKVIIISELLDCTN